MAIKFYMDEHIHPGVTKALRQHDIDVLTAQQTGNLNMDDGEHLQFAISEGRVLVTQDEDFLKATSHRGIAYAHQRTPMRQIIDGLVLIAETMTEEEMIDHIEYL
ncbi:MAG: hypothetical protein HKUEN02_19600 [Anaerolineaceae bacterium]|nr:MAG: hypothetical protein HKUEN02_19600 [Anaerolineaceae bacterium]